jgi:prevent-host-death family protein
MQTIAIHQAKNNFSALIHAVEEGEEVVLTRHGKRVARIILDKEDDIPADELEMLKNAEATALLACIRSKVKPGAPMDWRTARDAGHKY